MRYDTSCAVPAGEVTGWRFSTLPRDGACGAAHFEWNTCQFCHRLKVSMTPEGQRFLKYTHACRGLSFSGSSNHPMFACLSTRRLPWFRWSCTSARQSPLAMVHPILTIVKI